LKEKKNVTRPVTRASFLSGLIGLGALAVAPNAHAARNADAESYVQQNATAALGALGNQSVSSSQRTQTFHRLMTQFADMPRIATFVLGRYGATLRTDAELRRDWQSTFQDFAIATYEDQFENISGSAIRVTGSTERVAGRDIVVDSEVRPQGGETLRVQWRVLRSGNVWKVVDVAVGRDGFWLAQYQQRQFLATLDRNRGDIRALMGDLRSRTASLRQRVLARS
jgi:phospholipid transport system substrate-binding protein